MGNPTFLLSLKDVVKYLAYDCGRSMEIYESREVLNAWFTAHLGMVADRKAVRWTNLPADLGPDDYLALRANAKEITNVVYKYSPKWYRW
jgi:hypothetical protein